MRKELLWTRGISEDYDLEKSNHFTGEVIKDPRFNHLGLTLPGTLYGVNSHALKQELRFFYHFLIGSHIHLDEIFSDTVLGLNNEQNKKAVVIGMGLTGFTIAAFDHMAGDGRLDSGDRLNDLDFMIATENVPQDELKNRINDAVAQKSQVYVPNTTLLPVQWNASKWNNGNGVGEIIYEKRDFRGNPTEYNPVEFAHINMATLQEAVGYAHRYIGSFYSNVIGSPLFLLLPDENGQPKHYIWQPVEFDTAAPEHLIELTFPEGFDDDIRCLKEIVRGIHYVYLAQSAAKYYEPQDRVAQLSDTAVAVFQAAVKKYQAQGIPPQVVESCKNRLHNCIWRSDQLVNGHRDTWKATHTFENFPEEAGELYAGILDEIGWGGAILGMTVKEYLEKEVEST